MINKWIVAVGFIVGAGIGACGISVVDDTALFFAINIPLVLLAAYLIEGRK